MCWRLVAPWFESGLELNWIHCSVPVNPSSTVRPPLNSGIIFKKLTGDRRHGPLHLLLIAAKPPVGCCSHESQAKTFFELNLCVLVLVVVNRVKRNGLTLHLVALNTRI